ncbi:extracellular solute-binding protein [Pseudolabrys sp. Root1462]|uniref:extracellular solute-binding protein n=1 Tax=Pseudolabrys sp. Root1462 TaxID=1736466 RepID=UPI0009E84C60|nr:extracellular solute-binding protein [Pseudolabrys sp. Root1462]
MLTMALRRVLTPALLVAALSMTMAASSTVPAAAEEEKVLNVFNWSDYVAPDTIENFTKETGIKVNYDVYDSNDILETKLTVGKSGYDVVFPSASPFFARQVKGGLYRKLDLAKIPNSKGVDGKVLGRLATVDPGNAYGLPYMMAGTGVGYIKSKIDKLLPNAPIGSFAMLFDPKTVKALQSCGVTVLDAPEEVLPAALSYTGKNPVSVTTEDLDAAVKAVKAARPSYRYIHSSKYINDLAGGDICVAQGYAGDLFQARKRAQEAKNGVDIGIFLPKEGTAFNIDVMAIPKDAPHPDNAHKFINYILTPKVVADITAAVGYANAVPASLEFVPAEIRNDPVVFPPDDAKLYTPSLVTPAYERTRNRLWTSIKAGK